VNAAPQPGDRLLFIHIGRKDRQPQDEGFVLGKLQTPGTLCHQREESSLEG
jgi:hypothetical protein